MSKQKIDSFFEDIEDKTFGKGGLFTESEIGEIYNDDEDIAKIYNDDENEGEEKKCNTCPECGAPKTDDLEVADDEGDAEELEEVVGMTNSLSKALKSIESLDDKDRRTLASTIRAVEPKTGIGTPAANRLKGMAAGDDNEMSLDDLEEKGSTTDRSDDTDANEEVVVENSNDKDLTAAANALEVIVKRELDLPEGEAINGMEELVMKFIDILKAGM